MLQKHQPAPDFRTENQDGAPVSLGDFRGKKHVVLYFYPKDDTPGCTIEANQFTALADEFAALDAVVLGVSKDDCQSHRDFVGKYGLKVQLLADVSGELCESYGVWQEREKDGVKRMAILRSTFLIDKNGVLQEALYGVIPDGHAEEMLGKIRRGFA